MIPNRSVRIEQIFAWFLTLGSMATWCGCQPPASNAPVTESTTTTTSEAAADCEDRIAGAFDRMAPERLGVTSSPSTAVSMLNTWLSQCVGNELDALLLSPTDGQSPVSLLSDEELRRVNASRFSNRDANFIRDCILMRTFAQDALGSADSERGRVVNLFYDVIQSIALVTDKRPPVSPYEILLTGRGTAADRAWLFGSALRQMDLDAVILSPKTDTDSATAGWLVGVIVDGSMLLFDVRRGLPVPGPGDNAEAVLPTMAATLAEVLESPELLQTFNIGLPDDQSWSAESFKSLRVAIIGDTSCFAPRMLLLQETLSGDRAVTVYEKLDDTADTKGIVTHVAEIGTKQWQRKDITIWEYPEQQLHAHAHPDEESQRQLEDLLAPFDVPRSLDLDTSGPDPEAKFGPAERVQLKTRLSHILSGGDSDVTGRYQIVRLLEQREKIYLPPAAPGQGPRSVAVPQRIYLANRQASEDAVFWIGLSQFEEQTWDSARDTFRDYGRKYPDGRWKDHCRYLLAISLAERGDWTDAIGVLTGTIDDAGAQAAGNAFLIRRWDHKASGS